MTAEELGEIVEMLRSSAWQRWETIIKQEHDRHLIKMKNDALRGDLARSAADAGYSSGLEASITVIPDWVMGEYQTAIADPESPHDDEDENPY